MNAAGTALEYCGYIGGSERETARGIAVDSAGNAYVTGSTASDETTFPVSVGPDLTFNGGVYDAFVAKVNASGTALLYAGYIGGGGSDIGRGIAVLSAASGNAAAYVTGETTSEETRGFPLTVGPDLTFNGGIDAFVARVNTLGQDLTYCGYIGGARTDSGNGIAVDSSGNVYVTGTTSSLEDSFPVVVGPDLTYNGGLGDAFVVKLSADGTHLGYGGYIGGNSADDGVGIAVDSARNAYIVGGTDSSLGFPVTFGPDLTYNGSRDAFVARVNVSGTALGYAGYIGGAMPDFGYAIAVDNAGDAYITGSTISDQTTFPVTVGPDLTFNSFDFDNAFVAKISETISAAQVDLQVAVTDSPDPLLLGNNLTYRIVVRNNSTTDAATGVMLTDLFEQSATFVSALASQGSIVQTGNNVTVNLGTLDTGQSVTVTIVVQPQPVRNAFGFTVQNTAAVAGNETDPAPNNNTARADTTVTRPFRIFATGPGNEHPATGVPGPVVNVYESTNGRLLLSFRAFGSDFAGGVRVAVADVNGDGFDDIITGAGPGAGPHVKVFDGAAIARRGRDFEANPDAHLLASFFAYGVGFTGGVYVAGGDVNGDGKAEVITGVGPGAGPHVKVIDATSLGQIELTDPLHIGEILDTALVRSFYAYDNTFLGDVRVAAGDVDGDGRADVITGSGIDASIPPRVDPILGPTQVTMPPIFAAPPHVKVFTSLALTSDNPFLFALDSFYAYDPVFTGGVYVAARDMDGDGRADIITGAGPGAGPHVEVFSGTDLTVLASFMTSPDSASSGVRVAATDVNGDGRADIITGTGGAGVGDGSVSVSFFDLSGMSLGTMFSPYEFVRDLDGVFVGAGH